ncbi:MAG TPA: xanthine dehydrogenase family protein molybdopterin-binding subunit [Gaiellaceae bacterium]|nr:xanthine dehydrogenase family protein molybdopterin-binding subunit [Gaiellaceae bacterium]
MTVAPTERRTALGRALLRFEDRALLTGTARFVDDLVVPDVLHAAFVRSPLAHARIVTVDLGPARATAGVAAAFAADELGLPPLAAPCETPNAYCPPRPLLAEEVVRFAAEPLAVVVADSRYAAEDGADAVRLELDPLEPIVDPRRALADDAPLLHPARPNVYVESRIDAGDVDAAFAEAAAVVEAELVHGRSAAAPLEPRGVLALPDGAGLVLHASTQGPHKLRLAVAETLGLALDDVRVLCPAVGGGFGQKAHVYPEEIVVAWLALRLERPVKWTEDRSENLVAASHAREQRVRVRAAAAADGRLLALDVDQLVDQGAYGTYPHGTTLEALTTPSLLPGPYRLPALRVRARALATNKCPQGAYRGVGFAVSAYVHERVLDLLAAELGLAPPEIRRRNLLRADELPHVSLTNQRYDGGDYHAALELALAAAGLDRVEEERRAARATGRLRGVGVACYVEPTGMNSTVFVRRGMVGIEGYDGAHLSLGADGRVTVWTTTPTIGQGTDTTFAQIVAEVLGVEPEAVTVAPADTAVGGLAGTGTFASRSAVSAGGALTRAAEELRARVLADAAHRLDAPPDELTLADGQVRIADEPAAAVSLGELAAAAAGGRYAVSAHYDPPAVAYPYAAHVCVVDVDPDTGGVELVRYAIADDCGRVINPMIVAGQVHGATAQGIAEALFEAVRYDDAGRPRNGTLYDFLLPTAAELPAFALEHCEIPSPTTVHGVKGVGEGGTIGAAAAVANAVCDALGLQLNEIPLDPERIRAEARRALARVRPGRT